MAGNGGGLQRTAQVLRKDVRRIRLVYINVAGTGGPRATHPMGRALGGFTRAVRWVGLGSLGWVRDLASLGWVGLNWAEPGLPNEPMHDY